nr:hypothetical protein OH820_16525 [Streptomyces sp. NBC_00857]
MAAASRITRSCSASRFASRMQASTLGRSFSSQPRAAVRDSMTGVSTCDVSPGGGGTPAPSRTIRKIAEELKVRPQWVEWKGEGADAFRTWSGDLANSTLRLGDFSEDSAKWLGRASDAIAQAQVAIPRDAGSAQANLDAAQAAHNDPDAAAVSSKSASELAALAAGKEKVRQEAAAQMVKLG